MQKIVASAILNAMTQTCRMTPLRWLASALLWLALLAPGARADATWIEPGADGQPVVHLYFFWSLTCPHCLEARPFIEAIPAGRPWVKLHSMELARHPVHARHYVALADQLGQSAQYVPALLFCGRMQTGWDSDAGTGQELLAALDACRDAAHTGSGLDTARSLPAPTLPLLGKLEADTLSLPLLTVLIAGLDAFNPCAFFVLLFLLSMMAHQNSRARMLTIGGVFVLTSGLMYFAFMAAWLNLFHLLGNLAWVTLAAGAMALAVGLINVKDFFRFGRGISLSIPESRKPAIYRRARAILAAGTMPAMLAATLLLAVAVNFYELLCTAGFPMVYTRLLTLQDIGPAGHYLYLALYNVVYVIPLAVIVGVFSFTLGARKLSEREGRLLKLMSGLMMLQLGMLLVLAPDWLNRLGVAFALIGIAIGVTWIAARVTRR
ncbi:MAG: hypothetical protein U0938_03590 [Thiobacillus sp.]|nr:hypothetical protein [Thiobacillus sp.]